MTATNHIVTGAVGATFITNPAIAIPAAFFLHFVLDALPHYGRDKRITKESRAFKMILLADGAFAASFLLSIVFLQPENWPLLIICGIVCASPDLMWLPRWLNDIHGVKNRPMNAIETFHHKIQWGERPWGWIIEIIWFAAFFWVYLARTAPI